jgi:hypothetical protein
MKYFCACQKCLNRFRRKELSSTLNDDLVKGTHGIQRLSYLVANSTKAPKVVLQNMSQTRFEFEAILKGTRGIWRQPIHCTLHRKFLLSAKGIKSTLQITVVLARVHISMLVKLAVVRV